MMLSILLWVVAGLIALGLLLSIAKVGKPREPLTGGGAVATIVLGGFYVIVIVIAAIELSR